MTIVPRSAADNKGTRSRADLFTVDVEDWFHILEIEGAPDLSSWDTLESRIEKNMDVLLEMLARHGAKATCFVLGWVAYRHPRLVRKIAGLGHDVASHGFSHCIARGQNREEFRRDIVQAKQAIEDATGRSPLGYRAPGFSITEDMGWAFEEIAAAGYIYDSSVFPGHHGHGGMRGASKFPFRLQTESGTLFEIPISVADTPLGAQCFFGGGYLRLFPRPAVEFMARRVRADGRGVVWYIHPREIDPHHPRLPMPVLRRFKSYVNLRGTERKLEKILEKGRFITCAELTTEAVGEALGEFSGSCPKPQQVAE